MVPFHLVWQHFLQYCRPCGNNLLRKYMKSVNLWSELYTEEDMVSYQRQMYFFSFFYVGGTVTGAVGRNQRFRV